MPSLRQFVEAMQDRTVTARTLVLPLLAMEDDERPWTAARLSALGARRHTLDPVAADALEHLLRYEVPLLEREEALEAEDLPYEAIEVEVVAFERRFWEARFGEALAAGELLGWGQGGHAAAACDRHPLPEADLRRLAREQGVWDVAAAAERAGVDLSCDACRLAVTRVLIDELAALKADGVVR